MSPFLRWLARIFCLLALAPVGAAAQEPPKFLIETITVEGTERPAARQILVEESLLKPGQTYTEGELRQAVYRVKRLSFVIDADFSLRKGSARGAYELVIRVEEQKPLFFSVQADGYRYRRPGRFNPSTTQWQESSSLGGRYFVGSHGLAFGSVSKARHADGEAFQAGYTQYDLFGRGSFASLQVGKVTGVPNQSFESAALTAGIPLTAVQSLRADLSWIRASNSFPLFLEPDSPRGKSSGDNREAALTWIYDTTDDPLFATSGTRTTASTAYAWGDSHFRTEPTIPGLDSRSSSYQTIVFGSSTHYVPLTPRQSLGFGFDGRYSSTSTQTAGVLTEDDATVTLGHFLSLWGPAKTERYGDLRLENRFSVQYARSHSTYYRDTVAQTAASLQASLAYRGPWGVVRATFTYFDLWSDR